MSLCSSCGSVSKMFTIKAVLVLLLAVKLMGNQNTLHAPPKFATQHPNIYVFETDENGNKQDLILPCSIEIPSSTVSYTWFRGDQELSGSMIIGEGSLVVPNITEGEYASREGVDYYCIARDNIGFDVAVRSRTITVYYAYFDGFERMAENTVEVSVPVAIHSDVALECDVLDAKPPPQIKWYDDQGEIQEMTGNRVRFLDNGRYLYLKTLQPTHLQRQYYCSIINANLSQEISAPTRYVLVDNLTQGELFDYKQIGELRAFVGNTSLELSYVGGVFGNNVNRTANVYQFVNITEPPSVSILANIATLQNIPTPGIFMLRAVVRYNNVITTRNGTLKVYRLPNITITFKDECRHYTGERNLTYTCEFEGFPLPSIAFYFNGAPITADSISGVNIINNTLIIPSPQVSHSGIYQCIISNEFGDDQQSWLLQIRQPVVPNIQPYNLTEFDACDDPNLGAIITRANGSSLSFSVNVMADPCPSIEWTFNSVRLTASENITFNNPCMGTPEDRIWTFSLNVTLTRATSGSYSAKLINSAGFTKLPNVYFTIPEDVSVTDLTLNETCLRQGSNVALHCNVRGFPRPMIQFELNGTVTAITENQVFIPEFCNQIAIVNVTVNTGGRYACSVSGSPQPTITRQFNVCTKPVIIGVNRTSDPRDGKSFFLECEYTGIPTPSSMWSKDGMELSEQDDNIKIATLMDSYSRLQVNEASSADNGMYECNISNAAGFIAHTFTVTVQPRMQVQPLSDGAIAGIAIASAILIIGIITATTVLVFYIRHVYTRNIQRARQEGEENAIRKMSSIKRPSLIDRLLRRPSNIPPPDESPVALKLMIANKETSTKTVQ